MWQLQRLPRQCGLECFPNEGGCIDQWGSLETTVFDFPKFGSVEYPDGLTAHGGLPEYRCTSDNSKDFHVSVAFVSFQMKGGCIDQWGTWVCEIWICSAPRACSSQRRGSGSNIQTALPPIAVAGIRLNEWQKCVYHIYIICISYL